MAQHEPAQDLFGAFGCVSTRIAGHDDRHDRTLCTAFEQADQALALAAEMVRAPRDAEGSAKAPDAIQAAKVATAGAELEQLHAEASYRVGHAELMEMIGDD